MHHPTQWWCFPPFDWFHQQQLYIHCRTTFLISDLRTSIYRERSIIGHQCFFLLFLLKHKLHLGVENVWVGALSYRTRQQCYIFPIGRHNKETPLFLWGQCSASWAKINMASGRAILNISGPPAEALQNTAHGLHPLSHVSCVLGSMCWFEMLMSRPFFYYSGALLKVYRHH